MTIDMQNLSEQQRQLVEQKTVKLQKARELQAELANVRADLAKFDVDMVKAGFRLPVVACW